MDLVNLMIWAWYSAGFAALIMAKPQDTFGGFLNFFFVGFGPLSLAVIWRDRLQGSEHYELSKIVNRIGFFGTIFAILWAGMTYQIFILDGRPLW